LGFRFWKRIKIAPGISINLSKSGASLSFGPRGAKITVGPRGQRTTIGIPGTGIYYTTTTEQPHTPRRGAAVAPPPPPESRLTLGFLQRLATPPEERELVEGCREFVQGNEENALEHLRRAAHLADGAYLAGVLALKKELLDEAAAYFALAAQKRGELGRWFAKYGVRPVVRIPITEELSAHVEPTYRGVLLALVEVHQRRGRWQEAIDCLRSLRRLAPEDVVVKLSLAELLLELKPEDKATCHQVVRLSQGVENETAVHTALLLYKARALRKLGLLEAAKETLSEALRRKKDRPAELLHALRYERALVYEELGERSRARRELERVYAEAPDYEDVAQRLGLR